ncbi:septum site-determining protein MinC [Leptolyngbya sp. FACHB-16]|uniref:septum site-determining protein MinC n=1 Tax=unclassified Leptolyngbya TaxID=2650499 RepID=UPI0016880186|nr:septum site-determining protein MinC [Leptolyngbya sp. FACHB-16]MBD2155283.1 septum site-determining protein MinC [Leptolyngbya sp. FACHB-16]
MNSESSPATASLPTIPQSAVPVDPNMQVRFKSEAGKLLLLMPPEGEQTGGAQGWPELWQQLKQRLDANERFWQPNTPVHLIARDRLLDGRQLQAISDALSNAELKLKRVYTSRRQTAVAAATTGLSVEQQAPISHLNPSTETGKPLEEPLYIQTTVRSGMEVRHPGTVVIVGDVNPGSSVIADGDIVVWGYFRGVAHAGAGGNNRCLIMALRLEPTQLRIGEHVARPPEKAPDQIFPEVAYVGEEGIRITHATDFAKFRPDAK